MSRSIPEGWGSLEQSLEEERQFFKSSIVPLGLLWDKTWLPGYSNEDRGYDLAPNLYNVYMGEKRRRKDDYLEEEEDQGHFIRLQELTSSSIEEIPAMEKEVKIMGRLNEMYIKPMYEIIFSKVPSAVNERGKFILEPDEYATLSDSLSRLRIYLDYRNGLNALRYRHFVKKEPCTILSKSHEDVARAFIRKWDEKFYLPGVEQFGFLTFCAVDAHDNTLLPKVLKNELADENPDDILLNEIPESGIKKVILDPLQQEAQKMMRVALTYRKPVEKLCTANSLKMRLDRERFARYQEEIRRLNHEAVVKLRSQNSYEKLSDEVKAKLDLLVEKERRKNTYIL